MSLFEDELLNCGNREQYFNLCRQRFPHCCVTNTTNRKTVEAQQGKRNKKEELATLKCWNRKEKIPEVLKCLNCHATEPWSKKTNSHYPSSYISYNIGWENIVKYQVSFVLGISCHVLKPCTLVLFCYFNEKSAADIRQD